MQTVSLSQELSTVSKARQKAVNHPLDIYLPMHPLDIYLPM